MENKRLKRVDGLGYAFNLQFFAAPDTAKGTFTPDNVVMQDFKEGKIPTEYATEIIKGIMQGSKMMQLAKYEDMKTQKKKFQYMTGGLGAYWVGEGRIIQTTKPTLVTAEMEAKKLAVIVVCSRETLTYTAAQFFEEMKPLITEAFYKKFDQATFLNIDNPFSNSVDQAAATAGNAVTGALDYANLLGLESFVEDNGLEINAFISSTKNNSTLRALKDVDNTLLYDRNNKVLDGAKVVNVDGIAKGTIYAGNADYLRYGIPYGINFKLLEEAQLSSLLGEDGKPVNLAEREIIAMRATMDIGFMVLNNEAFAKLSPTV